jgi:alcohol dehydrogenase
MGDGKLGILCAWVLSTVSEDVTLVGHHPEKLQRAQWGSLKTTDHIADIEPGADLVVEATGSTEGFTASMNLCRPRGVLVLKSTIAADSAINLAPIVINEISVIGSRCGQFKDGLAGLREHNFPVESLVDARYPLSTAKEAFEHAAQKGTLKILLEIDNYRYHKTLE